ncbi:MAG: N-acetyltransferase [Verrucomicrobiae bacterium]|nr:N-acetyltransferase [Verrucomicrobiae bacterium]
MPAVSSLHASAFGPGRFARAAYRVREGTPAISPHCRGAFRDGRLLAALRMTEIAIGESRPHLLLGPLAVARDVQGQGFGKALVADAITAARTGSTPAGPFGIVLLVGDMPYYGRFGFKLVPPGQITFPGPVNPARILAVECHSGALEGAVGLVRGV